MPDAWTPPDDRDEPAPGGGLGVPLLLIVVGLLLPAAAVAAVLVVLGVVGSLSELP